MEPGDDNDVIEGQTGRDSMVFNGANISEHIDISANGQRGRLFRDVADVTMDLDGVEDVAFKALGGDDTITVNDLSGTDVDRSISPWRTTVPDTSSSMPPMATTSWS